MTDSISMEEVRLSPEKATRDLPGKHPHVGNRPFRTALSRLERCWRASGHKYNPASAVTDYLVLADICYGHLVFAGPIWLAQQKYLDPRQNSCGAPKPLAYPLDSSGRIAHQKEGPRKEQSLSLIRPPIHRFSYGTYLKRTLPSSRRRRRGAVTCKGSRHQGSKKRFARHIRSLYDLEKEVQ